MAKNDYKARVDGNGRVRFFVNGSEHSFDEYVAKYTKEHGVYPEIPVGLGGRAPDEALPVTTEEILQAELAKTKAEADFLRAKLEEATKGGESKAEPVDDEEAEVALVKADLATSRNEVEELRRQLREAQDADNADAAEN